MRLTLASLRESYPGWSWRGVRSGFRWAYEGRKDDEVVMLVAHAELSGYSDDDFKTVWIDTNTGHRWHTELDLFFEVHERTVRRPRRE